MKGILILLLIFVVVQICQLKVMSYLFENFFQVGIIAIVVVGIMVTKNSITATEFNKIENGMTYEEVEKASYWPKAMLDRWIGYIEEAYDTIENYNKVNEEKGYGGHLNHPGKTISWPFLRLNEYGELYIPGVGTMYLNKENGRFYEMPSYSFGEYKRIEE